jgi:guanyl-specific ribonuclease Sa
VNLFGRRKPLHERLLEEGGLVETPPAVTTTAASGPGVQPDVHGFAREREWDALATVDAPELAGDELAFDVLPDRTVLVETQQGDKPLAALAEAIERELTPPYRARAVRQSSALWAVAARTIDVVRLPDRAGDALELIVRGGERRLMVDGIREFGSVPELEEIGESTRRDYVVRAERLDDDWWEVRVDPL